MSTQAALTDHALSRLAAIVHERAGITLGPEKREMIEARLAKLVRRTGRPIATLVRDLERDDGGEVMDDLLDVLTTNFTSFFREQPHFDWLARWFGTRRSARVWCAACATGEEAYSLAITLHEASARANVLYGVELHATDLSRRALGLAQRGVYPSTLVDNLDRGLVHRWFQRGVGEQSGLVRAKRELRDGIRFGRHNLLDEPPLEQVDVIFLRNVMIYFDDPTQARVIARMREALVPGGFLVVGHAENVRRLAHGFAMHGHTILEKR